MAVRLEKVVLDLEDRFASGMVKDAAAVALLRRELDNLSGSAGRTSSSTSTAERDISRMGSTSERSGNQIDKLSGRLELFTAALGAVGPATVPIGALAVPAVAGLANQFGIAALAAGTLIGSMQGIGDAVKKLETARTAPTDASIEAARVAMSKLSGEGQQFALAVQSFLPALRSIRDAGGAGWFPGLTDAMERIQRLAPKVEELFFTIGQAGGDIAKDTAISLTSKRWANFFDFLGNEAPGIMRDLSSTVGDLAHGLAELWMAFDPTNDSFSAWMRDAADSFDKWASGLDQTQGFQEFIAYVQQNGPAVGEMLGKVGDALLQIVEAAAPLGGPTLHALSAIADVIAKIADSNLGTPLIALFQISSIMKLVGAASATSFGQIITGQKEATLGFTKLGGSVKTFGADMKAMSSFGAMTRTEMERSAVATQRLSGQFKTFGRSAALVGGLAVATSGLGDKMGYSNTASMALMGTMAGPWGTAIGASIGLVMDAAGANDAFESSIKSVQAQLDQGMASPATADLAALTQQLTAAKAQLDQLNEATSGHGLFGGAGLAGAKNALEGIFGTSDTEEAQAQYDKAASDLARLKVIKDSIARDTGLYDLYQLETAALNDNIEAMRAKRAEAARGLNAELDYKASLLDAADALKTNGKTVNENTRAGQANLRALYGIATAWNAQDDATKSAQGSLKRARQNFIDTATSMGMAKGKADALAKSLFEIPPSRTTKINLESDLAMQRAKAIESELNSLTRPRNIEIYAHLHAPNASGFGAQVGGMADGGTVPKIPGPYRDYRLVALAGGEQVITNRNGQADQYRADRAAGRIPAYADGGTVGMRRRYDTGWGSSVGRSGGSMTVHTERIIETLPHTVVLDAGELGRLVIDTADSVAQGYRDLDRARAGTVYAGAGSD